MHNFIEDMRQRPEEERLAFAMMVAGSVGLVLFLGWGFLFFRGTAATARVEVPPQTASAAEGLETLQREFNTAVGDISEQYGHLKEAIDAVQNENQGTNVVDLSVDDEGNVQVETIIIPAEELDFEE